MRIVFSASFVVALLVCPPSSWAQDAATPVLTRAQQEIFLRTAEITNVENIPTGITRPRRATLSDGTFSHDAQLQNVDIYKRMFRPARGRQEVNFHDSYKYNIAGYLLDQHLGLNMVPVSVEREVDGRPTAVTWWVDDVAMTEGQRLKQDLSPPNQRLWTYQMYTVRVFQQLIDNTDPNTGNLVITNDWQIWMIDFTRAFRTFKALRYPEDMVWCDRVLLAKLRTLDGLTLTNVLGDHLTEAEIEGLVARAGLIVEYFDALIAEQGPGAVLFSLPARP